MSEELKNVLVIGASGNLGPSIIKALEHSPQYCEGKYTILSRKSSGTKYDPCNRSRKISDHYPEDELLAAFEGEDAIINMAPITQIELHKRIIDIAIKAGVKRLILSEFGTNVPELQTTEPVPIYQGKIEIREYMKSKEGQGLTWTGLVVGAFFDWGLKDGFLGFDLKTRTATIYDSGGTMTNFTNLDAVGKATVGILTHPVETANRYVFIISFQATQNYILYVLETVTGEKWNVKKTTCEEESRLGREMMEKGDWSGVGHAIMAASYSGGKHDFTQGRELDNRLLGVPQDEDPEKIIELIVSGKLEESAQEQRSQA